jgi:hypothetical protein
LDGSLAALAENLFPVAAWVRMRSMLRGAKERRARIGAIGHGRDMIEDGSIKDTGF